MAQPKRPEAGSLLKAMSKAEGAAMGLESDSKPPD